MLPYPDRTHAWSAAAVGNGKSFVQVQVHDIRADFRRAANSNHGVHVGAVHVHLAAIVMHDLAQSP